METPVKHLPGWRYKYGQTQKIIETEAELEEAAAEGWVDHPVDFAPVPEAELAAAAAEGWVDHPVDFAPMPAPIPVREAPKPKPKHRRKTPTATQHDGLAQERSR